MLTAIKIWLATPGNLKKLGIYALVAIVLLGAAYTVGYVRGSAGAQVECANGKADAANETTNKIKDSVAKHGKIENANNRLPDSDVDAKLRAKWLRGTTPASAVVRVD